MSSEIRYAYSTSGLTLDAALRNTSGQVWYVVGEAREAWGTGGRTLSNYSVTLVDKSGGLYIGDMPSGVPRMTLSFQVFQRVGALPADTDPCLGYSDFGYGAGAVDVSSGSLSLTGLTCSQMISEVQTITGATSTDEPVATTTQITRWINRGQVEIARECPGLMPLVFKNTTSHDITQSLRYSMDDITAGDSTLQSIAHMYDVFYLDGQETEKLRFLPTDEFDGNWPDPTHSDIPTGIPAYWTRRNRSIEIMPLSSCGYCNNDLRFDGDIYPRDFTTNSTYYSDISLGVESGLVVYAVAEYYKAIGEDARGELWSKRFSNDNPSDEANIGWLEKFKEANNIMTEWQADLFYPIY